jgi:RNA polymerase sigma factor (sigma-70 family)
MWQPVNDGSTKRSEDPCSPSMTDEQLMAEFQRGSDEAFTNLFHRYRQPLFGFFRRRVTDASLAEELTQETFIAVLCGIAHYEAMSLFRTYLYAIGFRILRSYWRKAFFRAGFTGTAPLGHEPSTRPSIESDLLLREALHKLDRVDREVLLLREFEQLAYAEIGVILRVPVNTVRSRLFRARSALRALLDEPIRSTPKALSITKEQA